jgi:cytochrome b
MRDDQHRFLGLIGHPPARLSAEQTAWVLNGQAHDIPVLVAARLLRPLGNPPANGIKYFATSEVLELAKDSAWLAKITNTVCTHWQKKNAAKRHRLGTSNAKEAMFPMAAASGR